MFKVIYEIKYYGKVYTHESETYHSYKRALIECEKTMERINENKKRLKIDKAKIVIIDRIKFNYIEMAYIEYIGAGLVDVFENKRYTQYINKN